MTFKLAFELPTEGMARIQTLLKVLPKRIRNGAMRKAGRESAKIVKAAIQPLVPVSKQDYNQHGPFQSKSAGAGGYMHLRDGIISKVKTYNNAIFVAVGPRSQAKLLHAHLIEFGTNPRYTRHKSEYATVGHKRVKTRYWSTTDSGHRVSKPGYKNVRIRKSTGSKLDQSKLKKGAVRFTGFVRPYNYMSRGWASTESRVVATIETELRKALATSGVTV